MMTKVTGGVDRGIEVGETVLSGEPSELGLTSEMLWNTLGHAQ